MKKIAIALLFLCVYNAISAQNQLEHVKDSLITTLHQKGLPDSTIVKNTGLLAIQYYQLNILDSAIVLARKSLNMSEILNDTEGLARAYSVIGVSFFEYGDYPKALTNYFASLKYLEQLNNQEQLATIYNNIGNVFRRQDNLNQAIEYHQKALTIRKKLDNKKGIMQSFVNIANIYKDKDEFDRAKKLYFDALEIATKIQNKRGLTIINTNIGSLYTALKNYDTAIIYHKKVLELALQGGYKELTAESYFNIGYNEMFLKNPEQARQWFRKSMAISEPGGLKKINKENFLGLSMVDSMSGNFQSAYNNYKKYIIFRDSLFNADNIREITTTKLQYGFDKQMAVEQVSYEKDLLQTRTRLGIVIGISFVLALFGFGLYYFTRLKKKKEQQLMIAQQQILQMENEKSEADLKRAQVEISQIIEKIHHKDMIINQINDEINKLQLNKDSTERISSTLAALRAKQILTSQDWLSFLSLFNTLYPQFIMKLKHQFPKITEAEIRYLMLVRIGLNHKEMANMLGVSTDTVRVTWNRTRKKLGGSVDEAPQVLLSRLGLDGVIQRPLVLEN